MSIADWFSGRRGSRRPDDELKPDVLQNDDGLAINQETGEIEGDVHADPPARGAAMRDRAGASDERASVQGERSIPSVNREQSMQSRVSNALALIAVLLVGGGFLLWYYTTQFSRTADAELAAKRAAEARAAGENRLGPLGRVDPPRFGVVAQPVERVASEDLGPPPPPPPPAGSTGPKPKTAAELELERKLGLPVLFRRSGADGATAAIRNAGQPGTVPGNLPPHLAALLNTGGGGAPRADQLASGLGSMLIPTPTPAVAAQVLPTRRFLLPKGAFIDCTLETAIDSTFDGMTTCIGASDVYSADGKVVLMERGTKYVGEKRGDARQGQARVFVLWNEARTPTGVVVNLASPGTDELGRTGLPGHVDTHFWDRFGAAILISVVDGVIRGLSTVGQGGNSGNSVVLNPQGARDVMTEVLRNTIAIPPTIVKNQGDRIQILAARDVDFRPVYALRMNGNGQ